jgi:hypothetical protein
MTLRTIRILLGAILVCACAVDEASAQARVHHGSALLPDGRVLVTGGEDVDRLYADGAGSRRALLRSTAIFDPGTGVWSRSGSLSAPRTGLTAIALSDGRVLAIGGGESVYRPSPAIETWSPATQRFRRTGALLRGRSGHTATLLPDG